MKERKQVCHTRDPLYATIELILLLMYQKVEKYHLNQPGIRLWSSKLTDLGSFHFNHLSLAHPVCSWDR